MKFRYFAFITTLSVSIFASSCKESTPESSAQNSTLTPADSGATEKNKQVAAITQELEVAKQKASQSNSAADYYAVAKIHAQLVNEGASTPQDVLLWCEKAANLGHTEAMATLGALFYQGGNIPQDIEKAKEWLTKAAAAGNAESHFYLGLMHAKGQSFPPDMQQAWVHVRQAADGGMALAQVFLGNALIMGTDGLAQDQPAGLTLLEKAASSKDPYALETLGKLYATDALGKADMVKAYHYFLLAAQEGSPHAQYLAGLMGLNGEGTPKNPTQAFHWLKLAAGQGHLDAMGWLAYCYKLGIGTAKNEDIAKVWEQRAKQLNDQRTTQ